MGYDDKPALSPHYVQKTVSVNKARRIILLLSRPLADITELNNNNVIALNDQRSKIMAAANDEAKLEDCLYVPVVKVREVALDKPVTVCTNIQCCNIVKVSFLLKNKILLIIL